jgi:sensor c-di-GMP phosphodiesterase-like protein
MKVVAEGVETDVQRQIVLAAGCELSQGFHFARPMSGREFIRWAEERQRPQIPAMFSPVDSE